MLKFTKKNVELVLRMYQSQLHLGLSNLDLTDSVSVARIFTTLTDG